MRIYAFEVREDEKKAFEQISEKCGVEVTLSSEVPSLENADLVAGYDGVSVLGMGKLDEALLSRYRETGVRFLSTRTIGYNHIEIRRKREASDYQKALLKFHKKSDRHVVVFKADLNENEKLCNRFFVIFYNILTN